MCKVEKEKQNSVLTENVEKFKPKIIWRNIIAFILLHYAFFYTIYLIYHMPKFVWYTFWFGFFNGFFSIALGIGVCAHRGYAHKAFKSRWPLRILLNYFQTLAGQNCTYDWVRDHRVHHKFSDTDADPHNINRGFFFSHIGWLMLEKHPDVKTKGATIDMSDMRQDWVVMWQKKYYVPLYFLVCFILPTVIPMYFWGEEFRYAFIGNIFRYVLVLHLTWCTNSFAHTFGSKPYDKNIKPAEVKWLGIIGLGEGWHNYHHTFPWDYRCSELGHTELTYVHKMIEFFAHIGMAYDLKTVSQEMIKKRVLRTGDGTHKSFAENNKNQLEQDHHEKALWGWDDKDISDFYKDATEIYNVAKKIQD